MGLRYNNYNVLSVSPSEKARELETKLEQLVVTSFLRAETVEKELDEFCSNEGVSCTIELCGDENYVFSSTHN